MLFRSGSQAYQLVQANPALLEMLNLTEEDIAKADSAESAIKACLHPEDAWQISYAMKKMAEGAPSVTCNCRFYPKGMQNFNHSYRCLLPLFRVCLSLGLLSFMEEENRKNGEDHFFLG